MHKNVLIFENKKRNLSVEKEIDDRHKSFLHLDSEKLNISQ
jgi:hypothetical protein